jgi:hypothetical protein
MDKHKVIVAYRRGFITVNECAQILGMDSGLVAGLLESTGQDLQQRRALKEQPVNG